MTFSRSKLKKVTGNTNGLILWEGPSYIDGKPIVVIATGIARPSSNTKTGDLIQTWILRSDISPVEATKTGDDRSICGDCPHRHHTGGACYVTVFQAPRAVYNAYISGKYRRATSDDIEALARFGVRAGAYGDPAAAPLSLWASLRPRTGYTHQWRAAPSAFSAWLMASVDSEIDRHQAKAKGYRTFRVREPDAPIVLREIDCPSERGTSCEDCGLCSGTRSKAKDITIPVHGARTKRFLTVIHA